MRTIQGYLVVAQAVDLKVKTLWGDSSCTSNEPCDHFLYGELAPLPNLVHAREALKFISSSDVWSAEHILYINMQIAERDIDLKRLDKKTPSVFIAVNDEWTKIFGPYGFKSMAHNPTINELRFDGRCDITVNGLVPFPPLDLSRPQCGCLGAGMEYRRQSLSDCLFATWDCRFIG